MHSIFNVNHLRAASINFKRLKGIPHSKKMQYLLKTFLGEALRTRFYGTWGLRLIEISLTNRCNCRCQHCFAALENGLDESKDELSTTESKSLLDEIAKIGGIEVCFSGGEPLLREDIVELVAYAHKKGLVSRVITNGILLNEEIVVELKKAGMNWCSLSIDSPRSEIHDRFRGSEGCFNKVVQGLRVLIKHEIPCSIITVARKELIYSGELEEIVHLGKALGVTIVRINFPVPIGRFRDMQDQVLNREEREKVRSLLKYGFVSMESPKEQTSCTAAITKINVLPNGDVTPCVFVPLSYGNVRQKKFIDIWNAMRTYTKDYKKRGKCPMCDPVLRANLYKSANILVN